MAYVVDHILPLSAGGPDTIDNRQPAHRVCNRQKSDKVSGIKHVTSDADAIRARFDIRRAVSYTHLTLPTTSRV